MPKMTKLAEWLTGLAVFFGIYAALVTKQIKHQFVDDYYFEIQIFPLICIVLLGVSVSNCAILLVADQLIFHAIVSFMPSPQCSTEHSHSTIARKQPRNFKRR